jgi:hypothetical protein
MSLQQVHIRINDAATGQPTPVRLRITDAAGTYYAPYGRLTEFAPGLNQDVGGNVMIGNKKWCYIDGACEIPLPPGQLHIEITKGPEYTPIDEEITLLPGKMSLRFKIERWSDMRKLGWFSGDMRVHTLSPDAALLEGQAEDVAVVNLLAEESAPGSIGIDEFLSLARWLRSQRLSSDELTELQEWFNASSGKDKKEHDFHINTLVTNLLGEWMNICRNSPHAISNILSFSGQGFSRQSEQCGVAVGTHNSHPELGSLGLLHCHRVVYPLSFGGPRGTEDWTLADWCDQCHRKNGFVVWTEPALRMLQDHRGETLADLVLGKIDAIEIGSPDQEMSEVGLKSAMLDYYGLCRAGLNVPLAGASAKAGHSPALGAMRCGRAARL